MQPDRLACQNRVRAPGPAKIARRRVGSSLLPASVCLCGFCLSFAIGQAQIYVAETGLGRIGEYSTSGTPVNSSLISGFLTYPTDIAISGTNLFVYHVISGRSEEHTSELQSRF